MEQEGVGEAAHLQDGPAGHGLRLHVNAGNQMTTRMLNKPECCSVQPRPSTPAHRPVSPCPAHALHSALPRSVRRQQLFRRPWRRGRSVSQSKCGVMVQCTRGSPSGCPIMTSVTLRGAVSPLTPGTHTPPHAPPAPRGPPHHSSARLRRKHRPILARIAHCIILC